MEVVSYGPLRVSGLLWQPRPGAYALTVICKATFDLEPVKSPLAAQQRPPWTPDLRWDRHFEQMMEVAGDYAPFKRRADILVTGRAIPPPNNRSASIKASIAIGSFAKTIDVHVQQHWTVGALGPLAPTWPVRTAMLGRHASTWNHSTWNTQPLPEEIDGAFFNAASVDQQVAELTGQEPIVLEHLHPRHPKLWTQLVRVVPHATVTRANGAVQEVRLRCDTITIDADDGLAMLTWRGVVLLEHPAEPGTVAVHAQVSTSDSQQIPAVQPAPENAFQGTMAQPAAGPATAPIPFIPSAPQVPDFNESAKKASSFPPPRYEKPSSFPPPHYEKPSSFPPRYEMPKAEHHATMALSLDDAPAELKSALPFQGDSVPPRKMPSEMPAQPEPPPLASISHLPFDVSPPPHVAPPPLVAPPEFVVEKPAMLGPIAVPEKVVEPNPPIEQAKPPAPAPEIAPAAKPSKNLTVTEHATIAAELAEGKKSRAEVLRAHDLSAEAWKTHDEHWIDALNKEEQRGKRMLRETHDGAYLARVEEFRGDITLEEVARILVGFERRNAREVLDELRIQRAALMPIVRVWAKRIAKDARTSSKAAELMRQARQD